MMMYDKLPLFVEAYFDSFPPQAQRKLAQIRGTVRRAVPEAEECISYGIPTFKYKGTLLHYAAYENHIGLYPGPSAIEAFQEAFARYKQGKGSVQFPLNHALPLGLIRKVALFCAEENRAKAAAKAAERAAARAAAKRK